MERRAECREDRGPCMRWEGVGVVPGRALGVVAAGGAREVGRVERRVHPGLEEYPRQVVEQWPRDRAAGGGEPLELRPRCVVIECDDRVAIWGPCLAFKRQYRPRVDEDELFQMGQRIHHWE